MLTIESWKGGGVLDVENPYLRYWKGSELGSKGGGGQKLKHLVNEYVWVGYQMREVVHGASKCGTYVLTTNNILKAQSEHEKKQ